MADQQAPKKDEEKDGQKHDELNNNLLGAAQHGQLDELKRLIAANADPAYQEKEQGISAMMAAAVGGHCEVIHELLCNGAPWNAVDKHGRSAGNYALKAGHQKAVDQIVNAGVTAELIFAQLGKNQRKGQGIGSSEKANKESKEYIDRNVRYSQGKLLDESEDAVMMKWETPLMEAHAKVLCPKEGLDVLNIGFGMGIVDTALQKFKPKSHTIVEVHGGVLKKIYADGWDKKPGVIVVPGRWQDVMHELGTYDAIFFDTYGEYYDDMREFHSWLPKILREGGIYSFFNGFCPDNIIFQGVMCQVLQQELALQNIAVEFQQCDIDIDEKDWEGVKRKYFWSNTYYLPIGRKASTASKEEAHSSSDNSNRRMSIEEAAHGETGDVKEDSSSID